jgi:hypothetical protein
MAPFELSDCLGARPVDHADGTLQLAPGQHLGGARLAESRLEIRLAELVKDPPQSSAAVTVVVPRAAIEGVDLRAQHFGVAAHRRS